MRSNGEVHLSLSPALSRVANTELRIELAKRVERTERNHFFCCRLLLVSRFRFPVLFLFSKTQMNMGVLHMLTAENL